MPMHTRNMPDQSFKRFLTAVFVPLVWLRCSRWHVSLMRVFYLISWLREIEGFEVYRFRHATEGGENLKKLSLKKTWKANLHSSDNNIMERKRCM